MRYPDNYTQEIEPAWLKALPEFAEYDGTARDLVHLRGLKLKTSDVEKVVYVGERENVFVEHPEHGNIYPWRNVLIVQRDENGEPIVDGWKNAPPLPADTDDPRAYSTVHITSLGMTDAELAKLAKEHLGEDYVPDGPGPSLKRREVYDRVIDKLVGSG